MANGRREAIELPQLNQAPANYADEAHKIPGILVALDVNGTPAGTKSTLYPNYPNGNTSRIFGRRAHAWYQDGINLSAPKDTDDKAVIGYSSEGLPFQIIVNGEEVRNDDPLARAKIFSFVSDNILPLMDWYAEKLSDSGQPEELMKELIRTIEKLMPAFPKPVFTLSLALTYSKNDSLFVAGFGVGDTGLVLQSVNPDDGQGELKQLSHTTYLGAHDSHEKDRFGRTHGVIETIIDRCSIFNEPVYIGDELFGYTFLFPELLEEVEEEDTVTIGSVNICKTKLSPNNLNTYSRKPSLFDAAEIAINRIFDDLSDDAETKKKSVTFGDDCMLSSVTIPTEEVRLDIKTKIFYRELARFENTTSLLGEGEVKRQATVIAEKAKKLASAEDLTELARDLAVCNRALKSPTQANMKALHRRANKPHQFPSLGRMILSAALIILGATLALIGTILILGGAALLPTGPLTGIGVGGIVGGALIGATGISIAGTGIGIFASGYRGKAITSLKEKLIEENQARQVSFSQ